MPTAITRHPTDATKFVLGGVAASLGVFGLLRLSWTEAHVVLPITQLQGAVAAQWFGYSAPPVAVTLACSGADALALCLGAVLAYPVRWRARVAGAAGATALTLGLNTIRIATLGRAAASPAWFAALHLYVWPALLTVAIAGYVFGWMRIADGGPRRFTLSGLPQPSRRFIALTIVFVIVFLAISPLYLESAVVLTLAGVVARAAAATLGVAGIDAHAAANVLWMPRGGFVVTQECIATPLIPVYLAAVCAYSGTSRRLVAGVLATLPIFMALGVARLLVVALPGAAASPLFWIHAFFQLLLGAIVVCLAAIWRHRGTAGPYTIAGIATGVAAGVLLAPLFARMMASLGGTPLDDPQGAIAFVPAFQMALYVALWVAAAGGTGWKRFAVGFAMLGVAFIAGMIALHVLAAYGGVAPHVRDVRAWAIAGPVLIFAAVTHHARARG